MQNVIHLYVTEEKEGENLATSESTVMRFSDIYVK